MPDFGDRWQLIKPQPIGKGGQSHVYLVRDAKSGAEKQYAAKLLNGPAGSERRERLVREIALCRQFDHPNVVPFIDAGETQSGKYPFLVMPYYERGSLEDFRTSLSGDPVEILSFFAKICDGVAYIHGNGVVHRDIKPGNIFVADNIGSRSWAISVLRSVARMSASQHPWRWLPLAGSEPRSCGMGTWRIRPRPRMCIH